MKMKLNIKMTTASLITITALISSAIVMITMISAVMLVKKKEKNQKEIGVKG